MYTYTKGLVTCCNTNQLKSAISATNDLVMGFNVSNMDVFKAEATNSKTWIPHTHVQPGSTKNLYNLISPSLPKLWCWISATKVFGRILWFHIEVDLWLLDINDHEFIFIIVTFENWMVRWSEKIILLATAVIGAEAYQIVTIMSDNQNTGSVGDLGSNPGCAIPKT